MAIDLTKHTKIWINADGIIPDKIVNRLLAQQKVRPEDKITLFVNQACYLGSAEKIEKLKEAGIELINVEAALRTSDDDPYLVKMVNCILEKAKDTRAVEDYVFAADILRMMNIVQDKGLYSDTDVLFLPTMGEQIAPAYLFGTHAGSEEMGPDTNVLGINKSLMSAFHHDLITSLKEEAMMTRIGSDNIEALNKNNVDCLRKIPGIMYYSPEVFRDELHHTISNFTQTQGHILFQIEDHSFTSEENKENLYQGNPKQDKLLHEFKKQLNALESSNRVLRKK